MLSSLTSTYSVLPAAMLLAAVAGSAIAVPIVHNLGVMPGGQFSTRAVVAADGTTCTAWGDTTVSGPYDYRTFRWTVGSGITHILPLSGARGGAISNDGFGFSGGSGVAGNGFHWSIPGGVTLLNPLGGDLTCRSAGISSGAAFVCGSSVNGPSLQMAGRRAVRWTYSGVATNLGFLPGGPGVNPGSDAIGISADGSVVVGHSQWSTAGFGTVRAFKWVAPAGPMQNLGTNPGGTQSMATAVSSDNIAVIGHADTATSGGQWAAFRHKPSTGMQSLGTIPGDGASWANATNFNGSCVVGSSEYFPTTMDRAMIWTAATGMVDLMAYAVAHGANVAGWGSNFRSAWGVSADGTAVSGTGFFNGHERAFLITGLPCIDGFFIWNPNPTTIVASSGTVGGHGTTATFSCEAEGAGPLEYSWDVTVAAGMPPITLTGPQFDDPLLGLSFTVEGWNTPQITISEMRSSIVPRDISFNGGVTNPCGRTISAPATLAIRGTCPADFNVDTTVDFFDYLDFVDAFSGELATADFNGDGAIDFFDYLDFVDAFSAGC